MVEIASSKIIDDFEAIPYLRHDKKSEVLKLLIKSELNIISISNILKMNPGTVRRHLDDLLRVELVELVKTEKNEYGQKEKYYRSTAKRFNIRIEFDWP